MESARCKNLRRIFLRHTHKGESASEVYAYSVSFVSLEELRKEQVREIEKLKINNWPYSPTERMMIEDKIKWLEESLQTIDKFMEWENKAVYVF